MARKERSAGFILFRIDPSEPQKRLYLLLDYGEHWDFPKGHVESGEADLDAAYRELEEETGIESLHLIDGFAREITYFFRHKKRGLIHKVVIFFLARTEQSEIRLSYEHVGFDFLSFEQATARLTYASARDVLHQAHEFLNLRPGATSSAT